MKGLAVESIKRTDPSFGGGAILTLLLRNGINISIISTPSTVHEDDHEAGFLEAEMLETTSSRLMPDYDVEVLSGCAGLAVCRQIYIISYRVRS